MVIEQSMHSERPSLSRVGPYSTLDEMHSFNDPPGAAPAAHAHARARYPNQARRLPRMSKREARHALLH